MMIKVLILIVIIVLVSLLYSTSNTSSTSEAITKPPDTSHNKQECDNYNEIIQFEKPKPVVWTARFDTCLVSCWGAAFTRVPADSEYPRFSGYVPDTGEAIDNKFLKQNQTLRISGKFTGIGADHVAVFDRKCVPTVEIEKIEIIN